MWLFNRVAFGNAQYKNRAYLDLTVAELVATLSLILSIFLLGLQPNIILSRNDFNLIHIFY